jgi:hypothetical protein
MRLVLGFVLMIAVSGCANTGLRELRGTGDGPDEFIISPSKPLSEPESYTALPQPTPTQSNLTDPTPLQDGVLAAGGRVSAPTGPIPARDGAVVQHASRFGVSQNIRQTLASEDEKFRKRKARFTQIRIARVDRYNEAYKRESLDARKVADQYRRAGVPTPTAPPRN